MIKNTIIHQLINQLRRIKPETIYARSVDNFDLSEAEHMNRAQLDQGKLSDNTQMDTYAPRTVEDTYDIRTRKVSRTEPISFKDTGSFHKSIKAKVNRKGDLVFSSRAKTYQYVRDYIGERTNADSEDSALGLTPENLKDWYEYFIAEKFKDNLINRILYGQ